MKTLGLYIMMGTVFVVVLLAAVACAPAAAPTPTAAPPPKTNPTAAAPAKPAPAETAAPKPAGSPSAKAEEPKAKPAATASVKAATGSDWKAEWDDTVAAAKKEGKLVLFGMPGEQNRTAAMAFQKAYPEIQIEWNGGSAGAYVPKLLAERAGGQYLLDLFTGGAGSVYPLIPQGALDPLKPALILPEVLDDSKWLGGLDGGWGDKAGKYVYLFARYVDVTFWINRDLIPRSELSSVDQLVDPKFKGKVVTTEVRQPGPASTRLMPVLANKGEDFLRKLLAQDFTIVNENRQQLEAIVRGSNPISIGTDRVTLAEYKQQGLGTNIEALTPDDPATAAVSAGAGSVMLVNRAPHPNAAKLYINWMLSEEGQRNYVKIVDQNSRRVEVGGSADIAPKAGIKYLHHQTEEFQPYYDRVIALAREVIK